MNKLNQKKPHAGVGQSGAFFNHLMYNLKYFYTQLVIVVFIGIALYFLSSGSGLANASDSSTLPSENKHGDRSDSRADQQADNNEKVVWLDYDQAVQKADKDNIPFVLLFYSSTCRKCEILEKKGFNQPDTANYVNKHFVAVRINGDKSQELIKKYRIIGYPTVWFLTPEAKQIDAIIGYVDPDKLFTILTYIGDGVYIKQSYSAYEKQQKQHK